MSNNNEATSINSDNANKSVAVASAQSNQPGQRAGNQQNQQRNPRRELTADEKKRLDFLIAEKMKNPNAARELLSALESTPGARFVGFRNGFTTQMLKVLQDTDRGLSALDSISVMNSTVMTDRHAIERNLATCMEGLVGVTADIAILANRTSGKGSGNRQRELRVLESNVKAKMKAKGAPDADGEQAGQQAQSPSGEQGGQLQAA